MTRRIDLRNRPVPTLGTRMSDEAPVEILKPGIKPKTQKEKASAPKVSKKTAPKPKTKKKAKKKK